MDRRGFLQIAGALPLLHALPSKAGDITSIFGIRLWPAPDHTRIVLDLDSEVEYKLSKSGNPGKVILKLKRAQPVLSLDAVVKEDPRLKSVKTWSAQGGNQFVVEFVLLRGVEARSFVLPPNESYGHRLVLDLHNLESKVGVAKPDRQQKSGSRKRLTIAIDAGHGGEDPGAVGHKGTKEKRIVLSVARRLEKLISKESGMRAVMIRKGDYYVSLGGRIRKARKSGADLLISIHADGFKKKSAHGASVFVLSDKRASSEMARWMARRENRSDRIGGVDRKRESRGLAYALRDMERGANQKISVDLAGIILQELKKIGDLHGNRVHRASFAVLKAPDFPSMLVETGFITNPREERLLRTSAHQQKLANAMMKAVRQFAAKYPSLGGGKSVRTNASIKGREYRVKRGDTLSSISKKSGISLSNIRKLNPGLSDMLRIGQKIRIQ
ncbi:MAG: N-acetylmuramoyl-L-alanine amidase [Gammaproteobacteria bacterium]|uniref:N-acetylmuramoyl-L-alanine amidase AmiC n=1 Tax=Candidatus Thiopontia autotrophica TaxID=2841688 RepID=A0A8J6NY41_9GAMM|nr:N-acetylmuramoyl-L-alanine amidase [Candidatus Thiopontia autotrophica]MBL6968742.1 N-acetylmuramoyl-L-alanine amidase [Gammaproteobacteria bacterium]